MAQDFAGESAIFMERNGEDLISRQSLIFAKSPFEKVFYSKMKTPIVETHLVIEAPTKVLVNQPSSEFNFPKSDFSRLKIEPPAEKKEFIKIKSNQKPKVPTSKKFAPKVIDNCKEDWEKHDFVKLENWRLLMNGNTGDIAIIGYRSDIGEVNNLYS